MKDHSTNEFPALVKPLRYHLDLLVEGEYGPFALGKREPQGALTEVREGTNET